MAGSLETKENANAVEEEADEKEQEDIGQQADIENKKSVKKKCLSFTKQRLSSRSLFSGLFSRKNKSLPEQDQEDYGVPKHVPLNDDIVRSGHQDFQSLFATNDQVTPSFIVNRLGAP